MIPTGIAFTDEERDELGEYLDRFVAAGPVESLPEELFCNVQVMIARKIWQIRPDIAKAIQDAGKAENPAALLIKNSPIDDNLPDTPSYVLRTKNLFDPVLRSDYFNIGVGLLRYGQVVPAENRLSAHSVLTREKYYRIMTYAKRGGAIPFNGERRMHRDLNYDVPDDLALHMLRSNPSALNLVVSIDDLDEELVEKLKRPDFMGINAAAIIEVPGEGLRFHDGFSQDNNMLNGDKSGQNEAGIELREIMSRIGERDGFVLEDGDYLLMDQSRTFHAVSEYEINRDYEKSRWAMHYRYKRPEGASYSQLKEGEWRPLPSLIDEADMFKTLAEHGERNKGRAAY